MNDEQALKRAACAGRRVRTTQDLADPDHADGAAVTLEKCDGTMNPADSFSKYTPPSQNERDMSYLMGSTLPPPLAPTPPAWMLDDPDAPPAEGTDVTPSEKPDAVPYDAPSVKTTLSGNTMARDYITRGIVGKEADDALTALIDAAETGCEVSASSLVSRGPVLAKLARIGHHEATKSVFGEQEVYGGEHSPLSEDASSFAARVNAALAVSLDTESCLRTYTHVIGNDVSVSMDEALDRNIVGARVSLAVAGAIIAEHEIGRSGKNERYHLVGHLHDRYGEGLVMAMSASTGKVRVHTDHGVFDLHEPKSTKDIKRSPDKPLWLEAMQVEVDTIEGNETYHLRQKKDLPPNVRIFRLAWKFKVKRDGNGKLDKRKARLVLMGNMLVAGRHFADTFAIGARMASVKIVFAIGAVEKWEFDFLIDISGAYLNAWRPSTGPGSWIVSNQPEMFEKTGPNGEELFAVHDKYLYGDPASGRAWQHVFDDFLKSDSNGLGAVCTTTDTNLFRIINSRGHAIFAKHVDEIIGVANTSDMRDFVNDTIRARFKVSESGPWSTVLGFAVHNDTDNHVVTLGSERIISDGAARFLAS